MIPSIAKCAWFVPKPPIEPVKVLKLVQRYVRNPADAEDIAQRPQKARVIRYVDGQCLAIHVKYCAHSFRFH